MREHFPYVHPVMDTYLVFTQFLSHLLGKKRKNMASPRLGFKPTIFQSEVECANRFTMVPC
jgi:hypothetical protein